MQEPVKKKQRPMKALILSLERVLDDYEKGRGATSCMEAIKQLFDDTRKKLPYNPSAELAKKKKVCRGCGNALGPCNGGWSCPGRH